MRQTTKSPGEKIVKDIKRANCGRYNCDELFVLLQSRQKTR